jgi:hypothetical protein
VTKALVEAAIKDEAEYLGNVTGAGRIHGMGNGGPAPVDETKFAESMAASFEDMGWGKTTAALAANRK